MFSFLEFSPEQIHRRRFQLIKTNAIVISLKDKMENSKAFIEEVEADRELYIEYMQWSFITDHLYKQCVERFRPRKYQVETEIYLIVQRWLMYINQRFNEVPKQRNFPILPDIVSLHSASRFIQSEFVRKKLVDVKSASTFMTELLESISEKNDDVVPFDYADRMSVRYDRDRNIFFVNDFVSPTVTRARELIARAGVNATVRMILRYESLGIGSFQWGERLKVYDLLFSVFNIRYEGFSSPLNSKLIFREGCHFCSLFPDTDEPFGSLGDFFDVDMATHSGGWTVNTCFLNDMMKRVADKIVTTLDRGLNCWFFCQFPTWTDDLAWMTLNKSCHLTKRIDLVQKQFSVEDAYGNSLVPLNEMSVFLMGNWPNKDKFDELAQLLTDDPYFRL